MKTIADPAFLVIGAQRAATTWLYECLCRHPDLFLPNKKEVHFFNENYEKGWQWYQSHFDEAHTDQLAGEITPNYLNVPIAAERIKQDLPDVKLIVILREPVSRAKSSFELLRHRFPGKTFQEACVEGGYLVELGLYAKHLRRFYDRFEQTQILPILFEDVKESPENVLKTICEFVGVEDRGLGTGVSSQTNSVVFPRTQATLRRLGADWAIEAVKKTPLNNLLRSTARKLKSRAGRGQDDSNLKPLFRSDVQCLAKMINRDLSHWL